MLSASSEERTAGTEVSARVPPERAAIAEAVLFEAGGELVDPQPLGRGEVEEDRREEVLHRRALGGHGPAQALVEDALVRHVLVDQIEAVRPFQHDQRPLVLAQQAEGAGLAAAAGERHDRPLDRGRRTAWRAGWG